MIQFAKLPNWKSGVLFALEPAVEKTQGVGGTTVQSAAETAGF
jgi:hypothetical protein